ncbi:peptidoglycan D,D-transpeptidase FtsI family protein [Parablastomonas sp. CN1-191]|uniref:peptidoglycan D,D-transpeptidase FtsI family protein n=1 Tax=Parablastomonas sp. CN1-191 TaxID=3400908 RepID=UPI003BF8C8F0
MTAITVSTAIATGRVDLANARRKALLTAQVRALWVIAAFMLIGLVALGRIVWLGIEQPAPRGEDLASALLPPRGDIVDRNGVTLARAFPGIALWYDPKAMGEGAPLVHTPREVARALVAIFPDMNEAELTRRLASGKAGYLRRRILPEDANRIRDIGEPALEFPRESERYYPQGSMGAHVLGYVDAEGHGQVGMEQVYDKLLADPATRGTPAMLSIDSRVQGALEDELLKGMALSNAKGASGIVLDVNTGEVIALASLPSFNPNLIDQGGAGNIFNRFTNQVYELGSVMKPITIAAAIDAGVVTSMAKRYPAVSPLMIDGFPIHDHENYGSTLNVPETLIHSSNIVSAEIGAELGGARLRQTMISLGFNQRPTIELPARGFPLWPRGDWAKITTMTVSFGHGLAITPLHIASAYAALVNGGIWHPATLHKVEPGTTIPGRRVFKDSTSARMRQLLRLIVDDGTGRKANAPGFRIGGKTGSAEKPGAHGYQKNAVVATFASAFPMDNPRYVVIASLDEPQGTAATSGQRTAAWNAAPVVGRLVPRIGPLLGVMPDTTRDIDIRELMPLVGNSEGE